MKTKDSELNPNHPITAAMSDQWHKVVALMMYSRGEREVVIPLADIARFADDKDVAVVIHDTGHSLVLRLVDMVEAERLAREAGGLVH